MGVRTTISSHLSSYGSISRPSGLSRSPLMNVLLEEDLHQTMNNDIKEGCSIASHLSVLLPDLSMPPTQHLGRYEHLVTSFINESALRGAGIWKAPNHGCCCGCDRCCRSDCWGDEWSSACCRREATVFTEKLAFKRRGKWILS